MRPDPYSWAPHPEALAAVVLLAAAYAASAPRFGASRRQLAAFAAGALLITAALASPLHSLSFHLLSMHLLQNVVLAEWAPALLVVGVPAGLAAALGRARAIRLATNPAVALGVWLATYFAWHVPAAYNAALRHPDSLLQLEHATYVLTGCLLWWPVVQDHPHRLPPGGRAAYLLAAFVLASPLGLLLALIPEAVYDFYEGGLWGLSRLSDQQLGGGTMAAEEAIVFFAVFVVYFLRFLAAEERAGEPGAAGAHAEPGDAAPRP